MADVPVWLYGEAGSGKYTAAEQMADELDLSFRSISLGPSTSKADLMGYRDALLGNIAVQHIVKHMKTAVYFYLMK